jgi:hypothetical protein
MKEGIHKYLTHNVYLEGGSEVMATVLPSGMIEIDVEDFPAIVVKTDVRRLIRMLEMVCECEPIPVIKDKETKK